MLTAKVSFHFKPLIKGAGFKGDDFRGMQGEAFIPFSFII
jgi:hypothetical protein